MTIMRTSTLGLLAVLAAVALSAPVLAQKAAAPAAKKTTAKAASKTAKPKAATKKAASKKAAPAKKASTKSKSASKQKKPSACAGLARSQCSAKKECGWITPKKKVSSNGRKLTAYCRKTAGIAKKKPAPKKAAATKKTN